MYKRSTKGSELSHAEVDSNWDEVISRDLVKVDKVTGKQLSTNDYTTAEQTKLAGIATGATANQSDATVNAILATKVDKDGSKVLSDVNFTTVKDTKLSGIATAATANSTDATLLNRANHTGSQAISTITNLQTNLDNKVGNDTDSFGSKISQIVSLSQAQYDGITPVATTFYVIV